MTERDRSMKKFSGKIIPSGNRTMNVSPNHCPVGIHHDNNTKAIGELQNNQRAMRDYRLSVLSNEWC